MSLMEAVDVGTRTDTSVRNPAQARPNTPSPVRSYAAAALTLAGAGIHLAVAPDHLAEYLPYGIFFILLGATQVGLAVAILAMPSRRLFALAAAATSGVIGLWLLSRTVGLPTAPVPWRPEAIGVPDVAATVTEAVSVLLFLVLAWRPLRGRRRGRIRVALMTAPALLVSLPASFLGVGAALAPMPMAYNAAPAMPGRSSTSVVDLVTPPGGEPVKSFTLTAVVTRIGGQEAWAYNGSLPGPELRVSQGDRVRVTLVNRLPAATSIHWHGIRLPNAIDGVAGITQDAVSPGHSYVYEFIANDAGTFWYHAHQDTITQVPLGLLGPLIVEPRAGSVPEKRDYSLTIQTLPGDSIAINGIANLHLNASPGETVRLRLINASVADVNGPPVLPVLLGTNYVIAALDGHDLNSPQALGPERIPLGMGQRADLVFTMPAGGAVRLVGISSPPPATPADPRQTTATVTIGDGPVPAAINPVSLPQFDLTTYGLPAPDPVADAIRFDRTEQIVLRGGPWFRNGGVDFVDTFNGKASPYVPPIVVQEGDLVRLHIVNTFGDAYHPIHIHGHVFSVLAKNGQRLTGSPVHVDAVLVGPHQTWDVAFKADNPGIWMLHCHVLAHAASGMSMTINYAGVSTPFSMGTRSGNLPE